MVYGQLDLSCDCTDHPAFQHLATALPRNAVLITSDLRRTLETASAIRDAGLDLPTPIQDPALREQSFGAWQGMTHTAFAALPDEEAPVSPVEALLEGVEAGEVAEVDALVAAGAPRWPIMFEANGLIEKLANHCKDNSWTVGQSKNVAAFAKALPGEMMVNLWNKISASQNLPNIQKLHKLIGQEVVRAVQGGRNVK